MQWSYLTGSLALIFSLLYAFFLFRLKSKFEKIKVGDVVEKEMGEKWGELKRMHVLIVLSAIFSVITINSPSKYTAMEERVFFPF